MKDIFVSFLSRYPRSKRWGIGEAIDKCFGIPPERQTAEQRERMAEALREVGMQQRAGGVFIWAASTKKEDNDKQDSDD